MDASRATLVDVRSVNLEDVADLREAYRAEADGQIVHYSILARKLGQPYLVVCDGDPAAYGGVWTEHFPGRVMEFWAHRRFRDARRELFAHFVQRSGATEIEAQTNMPGMLELLCAAGTGSTEEKILFRDGGPSAVTCAGAIFRRRRTGEEGPEGEWVVELEGKVAGGGGILTHYNPPYADLYMAVVPESRRRGVGSYLVQELRRVCRERGLTPAARCNPDNLASWRALERGHMVECGRLLAARLDIIP